MTIWLTDQPKEPSRGKFLPPQQPNTKYSLFFVWKWQHDFHTLTPFVSFLSCVRSWVRTEDLFQKELDLDPIKPYRKDERVLKQWGQKMMGVRKRREELPQGVMWSIQKEDEDGGGLWSRCPWSWSQLVSRDDFCSFLWEVSYITISVTGNITNSIVLYAKMFSNSTKFKSIWWKVYIYVEFG